MERNCGQALSLRLAGWQRHIVHIALRTTMRLFQLSINVLLQTMFLADTRVVNGSWRRTRSCYFGGYDFLSSLFYSLSLVISPLLPLVMRFAFLVAHV